MKARVQYSKLLRDLSQLETMRVTESMKAKRQGMAVMGTVFKAMLGYSSDIEVAGKRLSGDKAQALSRAWDSLDKQQRDQGFISLSDARADKKINDVVTDLAPFAARFKAGSPNDVTTFMQKLSEGLEGKDPRMQDAVLRVVEEDLKISRDTLKAKSPGAADRLTTQIRDADEAQRLGLETNKRVGEGSLRLFDTVMKLNTGAPPGTRDLWSMGMQLMQSVLSSAPPDEPAAARLTPEDIARITGAPASEVSQAQSATLPSTAVVSDPAQQVAQVEGLTSGEMTVRDGNVVIAEPTTAEEQSVSIPYQQFIAQAAQLAPQSPAAQLQAQVSRELVSLERPSLEGPQSFRRAIMGSNQFKEFMDVNKFQTPDIAFRALMKSHRQGQREARQSDRAILRDKFRRGKGSTEEVAAAQKIERVPTAPRTEAADVAGTTKDKAAAPEPDIQFEEMGRELQFEKAEPPKPSEVEAEAKKVEAKTKGKTAGVQPALTDIESIRRPAALAGPGGAEVPFQPAPERAKVTKQAPPQVFTPVGSEEEDEDDTGLIPPVGAMVEEGDDDIMKQALADLEDDRNKKRQKAAKDSLRFA
jgi:hypothetical protein